MELKMRIFPIIPLWIMLIITIFVSIFIIKDSKNKWIDIAVIALLFLINLRIMYPNNDAIIASNNLDVLFVIDNTISMNAEDYRGSNTRLFGVKKDCKYIINRLNGARFSVITFNNKSKIVTPYTRDANLTIEAIDIISPIDELYAKGSSLNTPLENIIQSLESSSKKEDRQRIIFYISDGEITNDDSLKSFKEISKYVTDGAVLGYGTTTGGFMKETNKYSGETDYIMDTSDFKYEKAISKLDENNLKQIAKDINIEYINMEKQSKINTKLKDIENLTKSEFESSNKKAFNDTYFIFVIPLLILLIIKFRILKGEVL